MSSSADQNLPIRIRGTIEGRVFEGIAGITSNGMSKLLMDYPEQQQKEIMDLLFKPNYGASLQHLKVEIGSDVNTSCGTEPSHMRNRQDFDITRGYGLPIAKWAKDINPDLMLDALRWGTPLWIENDTDKLAYYLNFLRGARDEYGLEFDYLGPDINEGAFSRDWTVNTLRPGLVSEGFSSIKLVADDSDHGWDIADHAANDPELFNAVYAYGVHYRQDSTDTAQHSGKPLWLSEDLASFRHSFSRGALDIAKRIIDMYVIGRMTKYEIHPLIEAEYENTPFNYKGILVATWPWSGHYKIDPGLWIIAHYTQFIQPGWIYLDDGCAQTSSGGYVTLKDPVTSDISIVIVNNGPKEEHYSFELIDGWLEDRQLYVWRTNETEHFQLTSTIQAEHGAFQLTVDSYSIYSLTTSSGQNKGSLGHEIPESTTFSLPYQDDFATGPISSNPLYTSDQGGAFEMYDAEDGNGIYLRQQLIETEIPIDWTYRKTPEPYTLMGSLEWVNYKVSVNVRLEEERGYASLGIRVNYTDKSSHPAEGYFFIMNHNGSYQLRRGRIPLAQGKTDRWTPYSWSRMELVANGNMIQAIWNDQLLLEVNDNELPSGQVVLASGYHHTGYQNLSIEMIDQNTPVDCIRYQDQDQRIQYHGNWSRADGDFNAYARTLSRTDEAGAIMWIRFTGVSVSILCKKAQDCGIVDVFLDGIYQGTVDTYQRMPGFRKSLVSLHGLSATEQHELKLIVKGQKHPESTGLLIYIDAVEVVGGQLLGME